MMLRKPVIHAVARRLMLLAVDMEIEDQDARARMPFEMTVDSTVDMILEKHIDDVMLAMGIIIGKIENSWGYDIGLVFHHMGYSEDYVAHEELLYRLIMGCLGHGISIDDDGPNGPHATGLDNAGKILLNLIEDTGKRFEHAPVLLDGSDPIRELITEHLVYEEE